MNGIQCFFEGFKLVRQPGIRPYVIIPLIINIVILSAVIAYCNTQYDAWMLALTSWLPDWLQFLSWLVALIAGIIVFAVGIYLFSIVANIIASPFNAVLSEKIEERLTGSKVGQPINPMLIVVRSVGRELKKLIYFLPRFLGLFILSIIPVVNAIAPFAWVIFGGWMMAIQYADYAADNNQISFEDLRRRLERTPFQAILFGVIVYFLVAIPIINLILIPVAVAGGTVFWVTHLRTEATNT